MSCYWILTKLQLKMWRKILLQCDDGLVEPHLAKEDRASRADIQWHKLKYFIWMLNKFNSSQPNFWQYSLLRGDILFLHHMHLLNILLEMDKRKIELPRIVYLSIPVSITQIKTKQKIILMLFSQSFDLTNTHVQRGIKVQQVGILISRKQLLECEPSLCWAAVWGQQQHSSPQLLF